jgi:hypothetical protein
MKLPDWGDEDDLSNNSSTMGFLSAPFFAFTHVPWQSGVLDEGHWGVILGGQTTGQGMDHPPPSIVYSGRLPLTNLDTRCMTWVRGIATVISLTQGAVL